MYGAYPSPPYPGYMPPMYTVPHPMMYAPQGAVSPNGAPIAQSTPMGVAMQPNMQAVAMQPMMMSPNIPLVANQGSASGLASANQNGANVTPAVYGSTAGQSVNSTNLSGVGLGASSLSKSTPDLYAASLKEASASREQNRQISLLLAELDAAKDLNKKV